jgi:hypothetical protein
MNPKLAKRIEKTVRSIGREHKWSKRLVASILREVQEDLIMPILGLRINSRIAFEYPDDEEISLTIGCRDFQFDRRTGHLIGCGTYLG